MKFRAGGALETSGNLAVRTDSSSAYQDKQHVPSDSSVKRGGEDPLLRGKKGGGVAIHSNVDDSDPERGRYPLSDHVLVVAAVVCRVGLPAVLKVVGEHVVPAVLLLGAVGERH